VSPRRYATGTRVPAERTKGEVTALVAAWGATHYGMGMETADDGHKRDVFVFRLDGRHYRMEVEHPTWGEVAENFAAPERIQNQQAKVDDEHNRRWRARLLWLKATLEFMEETDIPAEQALLPLLLLPDGRTMGQWAEGQVEAMYASGKMPPLLGAGR